MTWAMRLQLAQLRRKNEKAFQLVARAEQFLQLMLVRFSYAHFHLFALCASERFGVSIVVGFGMRFCSTRNIKSLLINVINNAIAIASIDTWYWLVKCRYFLSPTHNGFFGLVNGSFLLCAVRSASQSAQVLFAHGYVVRNKMASQSIEIESIPFESKFKVEQQWSVCSAAQLCDIFKNCLCFEFCGMTFFRVGEGRE